MSLQIAAQKKNPFGLIISVILIVVSIVGLATWVILRANDARANINDWSAGRIIDDVIFTNKTAMTAQQIQDFLNSKVPECDTWGTRPSEFGGGTRRQWAEARGYSAPFTCMRDYSEGGKSAAQIIYDAGQEFSINPQVLVVLLQKEQSLVTDTWPLSIQYRSATGYGCPDTAACDSDYYGFTNQVRWAARMFRAIMNDSPTWYTPYELGNNYIRWSPTSSCGGTVVNIENRATQALYNYTPYQPNQAALNAGYGNGDGCSAYGNRNFYLYFRDWFGSPRAPEFSAQPLWQQIYTDSTKSTPAGWDASLIAGQTAYAVVVMKNTGNTTWTKSGAFGTTDTRLVTYGPWGRNSAFCAPGWVVDCTRPASLKEDSVAPGASGTFEFPIKAPLVIGNYKESFGLVVDGRTTFTSGTMSFNFSVQPATFSAQPVWQQVYTDQTKSTALGWNASIQAGQSAYVVVAMKNTGNMTWTKSGAFGTTDTRLVTYGGWGRNSSLCASGWVVDCTRPAALKEDSVPPGGTGTFEFPIKASFNAGNYSELFSLVVDGRTTFSSGVMALNIDVTPATFSAQPVWQQVYTDQSKSTALGWNATLSRNQTAYAVVAMKNTGNTTWTKSGAFGVTDTRLVTYGPWGRNSAVCDTGWLISCTRPSGLKEDSVPPGGTGTFEFPIKAPASAGTYTEPFSLVVDGRTTFNNGVMAFSFTVQ